MATKIITKNSSTASAAPVAADLSAGELAINTNDGKLFYKDSGGTVRTLASKDAAAGTFATLSASGNVTLSGGTANGVLYLNGSKVATSGSALTFDGTNFATTGTSSASKLIPTGGTATGNGLYLPAANTLGFSTNGTQGMTLDANSVLSVLNSVESTGAVQTNSANKVAMSLESASTGRIAVFGADTSTYGTLVFARAKSNGGTTESARIDSSGNLLVGTTSTLGTAKVTIKTPDNSGSQIPLTLAVGLVSDGFGGVSFRNPNGQQGSIAINSTTVSYNTTSDYRLKENVQPMSGALAKIAALKPCTYNWKANGIESEGFIAHELQEVVPQCVTGEKDAVDAEGNPVYQGIDTSFLVATLTAAIQELKAEVDSLKAQLNKGA
jgi:hypothetical protein